MNILVSEDIRTVCPEFVGAALEAHITNTPYSAPLWEEIKAFQTDYCRKYTTESIKEMPPIQATRSVYKRCGKGGFDAGKIVGDTLVLGIGREGEAYEGIGRGPLNIAGLPVYRDNQGGIGTPTSDHERTKLTLSTTHLLALVNGYDGNREQVLACAEYMQELLKKYAGSDGGNIQLFE